MSLLLLLSSLIVAPAQAAEAPVIQNPPAALVLTSRENGTVTEKTFSCSGIIHGYLLFREPKMGKHVLEGVWTGPDGTVVQQSRDELDCPPPSGRQTAYVWFRFKKDAGELWESSPSPEAAEENRRLYDGNWKVNVLWDNQMVAESDFKVDCPN